MPFELHPAVFVLAVYGFVALAALNPLLRAYQLRDWSDWWPLFFYRFVDPEKRMGENLNYAQRIRTARAEVLDCAWVLYHCPPLTMVRDVPTAQVLTGGASAAARRSSAFTNAPSRAIRSCSPCLATTSPPLCPPSGPRSTM